jgi:hypothetical protein
MRKSTNLQPVKKPWQPAKELCLGGFERAQALAPELEQAVDAIQTLLPEVIQRLTNDRGDPKDGVDPLALAMLRTLSAATSVWAAAADEVCTCVLHDLKLDGDDVKLNGI